jgi:heparosan-N-sulfate-glucuronate 5-epimerase
MSSQPKSCGSVASQKIYHSTKDPPLFFIMMRLNVKVALLFLTTIGFFTVLILWSVCGKDSKNPQDWRRTGKYNLDRLAELQGAEEIDCDINGEYVIGCRKEGDEVYLPFSFLHKYFEVYGKLATYDGLERFEWSHSYSKVYHPKGKYDPRGVFMYFENYNVEVRDRVKCVSAVEGVPISTQWESQGYYYPTQIAQFGLSHYSKNLTEPEPRRKTIEDGEKELAKWIVPYPGVVERAFDKSVGSKVMKFKTGEFYLDAIKLKMEHVLDFIMSLNIALSGNSSFSIVLQNRETREIYNLHYITSDFLITVQDNNVYHGLGTGQEWKKITRDLIVDLQKGLNYLDKDKSKHKIPRSKFKIITMTLRGYGAIDNLTLSSSEHIQQFYDAAEWFVKHQDLETGGWPIPVKRKLASGFHDLQSGRYDTLPVRRKR